MLSEQEILNNVFKDLVFHEEVSAKKFAQLQREITDPKMQKMFQEMEQVTRTRYSMLTQKMNGLGIL